MAKIDPLRTKLSNDAYLGFDFGSKKIGVAVGYAATAIASPLQTIRSIGLTPDWQIISKVINEWQPIGLVVGISRQQDGSDNIITPRMEKFCRQLNGRYNLPVFQIDESLTTFAAKQLLFDDLQVRADKLWAKQDQVAAQLILQSWFNKPS
ncbi:Holliday junction resolvase RuvX [Methylomonas paludis]|uniref:Putative pre-16S rRNA nuclease n=1 Tax=Methylomonas paludis TaxID=1173101 RepID=A0A975R9M2_9GAMM|nr:Holliday junction resolvase RuvX [Methylomonas paludis]QWF70341.1 Holliday junction resolvase RuvX [Methylomonas paludis]